MLTRPWRHQKAAFKFCLDHFARGTARHPAGHGHGHGQVAGRLHAGLWLCGAAHADRLPAARGAGVGHAVRTPRGHPRDHRRARRGVLLRGEEAGVGCGEDEARAGARATVHRGRQLRLRMARSVRVLGREGPVGSGHRGRGAPHQDSGRQGVAVLQAPAPARRPPHRAHRHADAARPDGHLRACSGSWT